MRVGTGERILNYVILTLFAAYALFPIITIIVTALGPKSRVTEPGPHFSNLVDAWQIGGFGGALMRSLLVALLVVSTSSGGSSGRREAANGSHAQQCSQISASAT